jgi:hypothetical protein
MNPNKRRKKAQRKETIDDDDDGLYGVTKKIEHQQITG